MFKKILLLSDASEKMNTLTKSLTNQSQHRKIERDLHTVQCTIPLCN